MPIYLQTRVTLVSLSWLLVFLYFQCPRVLLYAMFSAGEMGCLVDERPLPNRQPVKLPHTWKWVLQPLAISLQPIAKYSVYSPGDHWFSFIFAMLIFPLEWLNHKLEINLTYNHFFLFFVIAAGSSFILAVPVLLSSRKENKPICWTSHSFFTNKQPKKI